MTRKGKVHLTMLTGKQIPQKSVEFISKLMSLGYILKDCFLQIANYIKQVKIIWKSQHFFPFLKNIFLKLKFDWFHMSVWLGMPF